MIAVVEDCLIGEDNRVYKYRSWYSWDNFHKYLYRPDYLGSVAYKPFFVSGSLIGKTLYGGNWFKASADTIPFKASSSLYSEMSYQADMLAVKSGWLPVGFDSSFTD